MLYAVFFPSSSQSFKMHTNVCKDKVSEPLSKDPTTPKRPAVGAKITIFFLAIMLDAHTSVLILSMLTIPGKPQMSPHSNNDRPIRSLGPNLHFPSPSYFFLQSASTYYNLFSSYLFMTVSTGIKPLSKASPFFGGPERALLFTVI